MVVDRSQFWPGCGVPTPPAKWSPSSTVMTKSVLCLVDPVVLEVLEEVLEGGVVRLQLLRCPSSPGPVAELEYESLDAIGACRSWASEM